MEARGWNDAKSKSQAGALYKLKKASSLRFSTNKVHKEENIQQTLSLKRSDGRSTRQILKTFILNMFKEPKEGTEKVKNMICKQNGNTTQREI